MSRLLRKIRKARWYKIEGVPWLTANDIPADPLGDLATTDNTLSVWHVEDDRSNLHQVVAALAANSDDISNFDYALFDQQLPPAINIQSKARKGNTPDEEVNSWHRDLTGLSALKLVALAKAILTNGEKTRIPEKSILAWVAGAVISGRVERTKLRPKVGRKIDRFIENEGNNP